MTNKKHTGSYYTPEFLSKFILGYVAPYFANEKYVAVLEPSVGDGSFVTSFNEAKFSPKIKRFSFTALDKIIPELRKAEVKSNKNRRCNTRYSFLRRDFLKFQKGSSRKFSLITGNPPYIKKGLLYKGQIALCEEIHQSAKLAPLTIKNIWSSFLIKCTQMLTDTGVLAFVLPAEILQVNFSAELRTFLKANFKRIEIFTFDELLFECKGQHTVLLIGYKQSNEAGQFFTHILDKGQLETMNFDLVKNTSLTTSDTKWSHHHLTSDELDFIFKLAKPLKRVDHYCDSRPGIVTAANNYFIVNQETEKQYGLSGYTLPIIQKGLFVNGSVVFDNVDYTNLVKSGKPSRLLHITDKNASKLPASVKRYIALGKELDLKSRFKCEQRENWFVVPNISGIPDGFFFKRSHRYPKMLKNTAEVFVTDSAYKISMKAGFNINHLIYSFYNSVTMIFAELEGRYYGGGVLELTPSEFKKLPMPMVEIGVRDFNSFTTTFEKKEDIVDVLSLNDPLILHEQLDISLEDIERIGCIYSKLLSKRFRSQ